MPVFSPQSQPAAWQDAGLVSRVRDAAARFSDEALELAVRIATVPAPTGQERERAELVSELFRDYGVKDVSTDEIFDVTGRIHGNARDRSVLLAAHLDTVFTRDTP